LKFKYYIIITFIFAGCKHENNNDTGSAPTDLKDSLSYFISAGEDKNLPNSTRLSYNRKALDLLLKNSKTSTSIENLYSVSNIFYSLYESEELKKSSYLMLKKAVLAKDSLNIAKAFNLIGKYKYDIGEVDSSFFYYIKAEKFFLKLNNGSYLSKNYINKAFVQLAINDFAGCEISSIRSLKYIKGKGDFRNEYDAYNLVGISSNELKNYTNALKYHNKALNLVQIRKGQIDRDNLLENTLNNIGVVYQNMNNNELAKKYFLQALENKTIEKDAPQLAAILFDNLAYSKFKLNEKQGVRPLFLKSLRIRDSLNQSSGVIINKIHLSEYYFSIRDHQNSEKYAFEALSLAKSTKVSGDILAALQQISLVDSLKSSSYSKEYIKISDSLQQEERKAKDKFARIAFETDEIIQEKDKLAEQNRNLLYFFLATLFVGLLLFVIRTQRAKNRELLLKQQQQKVNEEIYNLMITQQATIEENRVKEKKRIAQELHDGVLGRLFGARLNLDSLNRFSDDESISSRFNYLAELKNIEQDIREISHDLNREKYVLINNFVAIVSNLLEEQANSFEADLTSSLDESIQWDKVSNAVKINLYRILQESLQNINKYANAQHISVEFRRENDQIMFKITDDGIGFDVNTKKKGIGLQNMQSRVQECDGTFEIKSKKGKGTTTIVFVPIEKKLEEV
jgi:signal transduction histidine kinase